MKKTILTLLAFLFSFSTVFAAPINHLVFFGDSLSDNGNLYKLFLKIIPKSPPYFQGRFSNGPTWAENVGKFYYSKYYIDYKIYAYGGATTIFHMPTIKFIAPTNLELEVDQYLLDSLFYSKSDVLYSFWIGSNDYLFDQQTNIKKVIDKITWAMTTLITQGARNFLVLNLPDLSRIPFSANTSSMNKLHELSVQHNQQLLEAVNAIKAAHPDVKINFVNIYDLFNDVMANPEKYNEKYHVHITNTTQGCWQGGFVFKNAGLQKDFAQEVQLTFSEQVKANKNLNTEAMAEYVLNSPSLSEAYMTSKLYERGIVPCSNADEYLFWDQMHPTEIVHRILSDIVIENLTSQWLQS